MILDWRELQFMASCHQNDTHWKKQVRFCGWILTNSVRGRSNSELWTTLIAVLFYLWLNIFNPSTLWSFAWDFINLLLRGQFLHFPSISQCSSYFSSRWSSTQMFHAILVPSRHKNSEQCCRIICISKKFESSAISIVLKCFEITIACPSFTLIHNTQMLMEAHFKLKIIGDLKYF